MAAGSEGGKGMSEKLSRSQTMQWALGGVPLMGSE